MSDRPEDYQHPAPAPNGCGACGYEYREHVQWWHPVAGLHGWLEPTDAQRLARMWDRRRAREQAAKIAWVRREYWAILAALPPQPWQPSKRTGKPGLFAPKKTGSKRATLELLSVLRLLKSADAGRREALRG